MLVIALDLFAGTGWGVACARLGIKEYGVEIMPEVQATRAANGMMTLYGDVWEGLEGGHDVPDYDMLIASPPCQTFSMAGAGAGRKALNEVLGLIDSRAYADVAKLREFGETHDPRTSLVLTPLAHVYRDAPLFVVFEQVPPVIPVWERCAEEMRKWGYSVWVGNLQAEQYGVPQTRKRAVLIARADGVEAAQPVPTHSRYYSRDPKRLDSGVAPWVSMAEALGWSESMIVNGARSHEWVQERHRGAGMDDRNGKRPSRPVEDPALTITGSASGTTPGGFRVVNLDPAKPATTVAGDPRLSSREHHYHGEQNSTATKVTIEEASLLQSYPPGFVFSGTKMKQFLQVGNAVPPLLAEAILKSLVEGGNR